MKSDWRSRTRARSAGTLHYFSTFPCKRGHAAPRRTSTGVCTECEKTYVAKYQSSDKFLEARSANSKRSRMTLRGRAYNLVLSARTRAKKYGLECDLDTWDVELRLMKMECEATGLPLNMSPPGRFKYNPWAPSLDRKDPQKGYVLSNVQIVCNAYNIAKNEWPETTVLAMAAALVAKSNVIQR